MLWRHIEWKPGRPETASFRRPSWKPAAVEVGEADLASRVEPFGLDRLPLGWSRATQTTRCVRPHSALGNRTQPSAPRARD